MFFEVAKVLFFLFLPSMDYDFYHARTAAAYLYTTKVGMSQKNQPGQPVTIKGGQVSVHIDTDTCPELIDVLGQVVSAMCPIL